MEAAIFNGFQSVVCKLLQMYCARYLQQRDEKAIDCCHQKGSRADNNKALYKKEITWDTYGKRTSDILEKGIANATDSDDFHAKLLSLKPSWEKLCASPQEKVSSECHPGCKRRYKCSGFTLPDWHGVNSCHWETHSVLQDGQCLRGSQHHQDPDRIRRKWRSAGSEWLR